MIGPDVTICTDTHELDRIKRANSHSHAKPITIGKECWIGAGAKILAGVTIGDGVVVAAGAIVTKDVPDNVVVAKVPAEVIKVLKVTEKEVVSASQCIMS